MIFTNFSFTKTPYLFELIEEFDRLRIELHLSPISIADKSHYRFDTFITRVHASFDLSGRPIDNNFIIESLKLPADTHLSSIQAEIVRYKKAHDFIVQYWLANQKPVTDEDMKDLYHIASSTTARQQLPTDELQGALRYLQITPDNPIIQSALAGLFVITHNELGKTPGLHQLVPMMFMYKSGYDLRRMICVEEYFTHQKERYQSTLVQCMRDQNATTWLELFADGAVHQLSRRIKQIKNRSIQTPLQSLIDLNERQKKILIDLDEPNSKISNRDVQRRYGVSPVTAARDLTALVQEQHIIPIGKGRSTYYIKK